VAGLPAPRWSGVAGDDWLVELSDAEMVAALRPDLTSVAALGRRALVVTAPGTPGSGFDFVCRVFAPNVGIAEDPVTGSAHCALGPYWSGRLGRRELIGYQASARGGTVRTRVEGDRVVLGGRAVTVSTMTLLV
jgi:predicted PhzF superfamily epimerase YddE/YHI9